MGISLSVVSSFLWQNCTMCMAEGWETSLCFLFPLLSSKLTVIMLWCPLSCFMYHFIRQMMIILGCDWESDPERMRGAMCMGLGCRVMVQRPLGR